MTDSGKGDLPAKPTFNPILSQFYDSSAVDADQVHGLLSYALYKLSKRE